MPRKREVYKWQDSLSSHLSIHRPCFTIANVQTQIFQIHTYETIDRPVPLCLLAPICLLWIGPSPQSMEVIRHVLALPGLHRVQPMAQEQNLDMGCLDVLISMLVSFVLDS